MIWIGYRNDLLYPKPIYYLRTFRILDNDDLHPILIVLN